MRWVTVLTIALSVVGVVCGIASILISTAPTP
jgi:hypothetical protein